MKKKRQQFIMDQTKFRQEGKQFRILFFPVIAIWGDGGGGGGGRRPAPFATSHMVGREDKITNNRTLFPTLKNNAAAGYKGSVKTELVKGAGLLIWCSSSFVM